MTIETIAYIGTNMDGIDHILQEGEITLTEKEDTGNGRELWIENTKENRHILSHDGYITPNDFLELESKNIDTILIYE